jgi:S-formylglutathione hydrolase FrmB
MKAIIPQKTGSAQIGMSGAKKRQEKYPVLYLLHGMSDDHSIWIRRTSVERYASDLGLIVIMPAAAISFYTDMAHGSRYWTFLSEELPEIVRAFFPASEKREDNFAAGLSMGGYGAFKLALRKPESFAAAASLSGALVIQNLFQMFKDDKKRKTELKNIFGKNIKREDDLLRISQGLAKSSGPKPKLYQSCGTEDYLYDDNLRFKSHLQKFSYDLTYRERPGTHEWGFWDEEIKKVLQWLPIKK